MQRDGAVVHPAQMQNLQGLGFWLPSSEDDIKRAINNKLLAESHHLDVKKSLGPANDEVNGELARDLASFAVDGGTLIYGVHEPKPGVFRESPIDTGGLGERIEQVALMRLQPSLFVRTTQIQSAGKPEGHGFLVVHIPPSADAPHMVAGTGTYWGRNDKTKYALPDDEVERFILARRRAADSILPVLDDMQRRVPVIRDSGNFYMTAEPVRAIPGMGLPYTHEPGWEDALRELARTSTMGGVRPDLTHDFAPLVTRRPGGAALTVSPDSMATLTRDFIELNVTEDGGLRLASQNASALVNGHMWIFDDLIYSHVRRVLSIATIVSRRVGYGGPWDLGVKITGINNGASGRRGNRRGYKTPEYTYAGENIYTEVTRASTFELADAAPRVAGRLLGRLLRSIGSADEYDLG